MYQIEFGEQFASSQSCEQVINPGQGVSVRFCCLVDSDLAHTRMDPSRFSTSTMGAAQFENCTVLTSPAPDPPVPLRHMEQFLPYRTGVVRSDLHGSLQDSIYQT